LRIPLFAAGVYPKASKGQPTMLSGRKETSRVRVALVILSAVTSMIGGQQIATAGTIDLDLGKAATALT
jgi:hypothetical protein